MNETVPSGGEISRSPRVAIVDYGVGNLGSIANIVRRVGGVPHVAARPSDLVAADHVILPGVGSFDVAMGHLRRNGMIPALREHAFHHKKPLLGVCLGMQLLGTRSGEGQLEGLGWIPAEVIRFTETAANPIRVPHIGWNSINVLLETPLLDGLRSGAEFYFVHSFHLGAGVDAIVAATCDYGSPFPAVIEFENIAGTQFHPEKSQDTGEMIFRNFLNT